MRLISKWKLGCIVLVIFLIPGQYLMSQETPVWNKSTLRDSVTALLSKYQILHNQLNSRSESRVEWEFMHLFSNPKVQVVDDLDGDDQVSTISIEEFLVRMGEVFPEGRTVNLDLSGLAVGQPKYDRNNRYVFRIRVHRAVSGISGGKVVSSDQKVIYLIAFFMNNNSPDNFTIYGIELPPKGQGFVTATLSPSYTGFMNSAIATDNRIGLSGGGAFRGGLSYTYYLSDHWGFGSGLQFSDYISKLSLDKFDAFGGFDPNMRNVSVNNRLWFIELPVFFAWRTNTGKRLEFHADLGLSAGLRIFETSSSSAVNLNTGLPVQNIFSDADWIGLLTRMNMGLQGNLSMVYRVNSQIGVVIGCGIRQGLTGLDTYSQQDFSNAKYLGQYNPLWGAPGNTLNQSVYANLGVSFRLRGQKTK